MAFQPDRTLSISDDSLGAALQKMSQKVHTLWEYAHPLWKRWSMDPHSDAGVPLKEQGVRRQVHKEIDGGNEYMQRVDYIKNNAAGRADQNASFLTASNQQTQTLSHARWIPRLFQGWIGVGFQDKLEIQGGPAGGYDYVKGKVENNIMSLSRHVAKALYATGYVVDAASTPATILNLQGLMLATDATNTLMNVAADGYYGGINRITAGNEDWRGNRVTFAGPAQPSDIQNLYTQAQDGTDSPTLIVCGRSTYNIFWNMYEAKQRVLNNIDPTLGKSSPLSFDGVSIMLDKTLDDADLALSTGKWYNASDGSVVVPGLTTFTAQGMYFLNENYIEWVTWKGGSGKGGSALMLPEMNSTTNLNKVYRTVLLAALAVGKPNRQAVGVAISS